MTRRTRTSNPRNRSSTNNYPIDDRRLLKNSRFLKETVGAKELRAVTVVKVVGAAWRVNLVGRCPLRKKVIFSLIRLFPPPYPQLIATRVVVPFSTYKGWLASLRNPKAGRGQGDPLAHKKDIQ